MSKRSKRDSRQGRRASTPQPIMTAPSDAKERLDRAFGRAAQHATRIGRPCYVPIQQVFSRATNLEVGWSVITIRGSIGNHLMHEPERFMSTADLEKAKVEGILFEA